jgi:hypothetical protein
MHINVKSVEDILSEQQSNQGPDEEDKHEEAITQKPTATRPMNI